MRVLAALMVVTCATLAHAFLAPQRTAIDHVAASRRRKSQMASPASVTAAAAASPSSLLVLNLMDPMAAMQEHSMETIVSSSGSTWWLATAAAATAAADSAATQAQPPEAGGISYSQTSYYTILALYTLSFPGLWSTIQRSTTAKVKRMTFVTPGENAPSVATTTMNNKTTLSSSEQDGTKPNKPGLSLRQQAGEIMACTLVVVVVVVVVVCAYMRRATKSKRRTNRNTRQIDDSLSLTTIVVCFPLFFLFPTSILQSKNKNKTRIPLTKMIDWLVHSLLVTLK
jgi:Cofactor assembly of complex C subunit B